MDHAYFFGYGSLVNSLTHGYAPTQRARLRGWRRGWRHTPDRAVAYLTAIPDPSTEIDGMIAPVPPQGWAALDLREAAYRRHDATKDVLHRVQQATATPQIAVYAIDPDRMGPPTKENPILLSYLDVVLQGYLAEFGRSGAEHFLATTDGWDAPVLDDRDAPRYPRAQKLTEDERIFVDASLRALGCKVNAK